MKRRKSSRKARQTVINKVMVRLRKFVAKHSIALLSLALTLFASFSTYYLAYGEPDIRFVPERQMVGGPPSLPDERGRCYYYMTIHVRFKNLSFKRGYINDVKFVPLTTDTVGEFKLISIDKSKIGWREERSVEVRFGITLDPGYCERVADTNKTFDSQIYFYDNAGNQLDRDIDGNPYTENFNLALDRPKSAQPETLGIPDIIDVTPSITPNP